MTTAVAAAVDKRPKGARRTDAAVRLSSVAPLGLVGLAVLFGLWVLRGEVSTAQFPNDSALHLSMLQWASDRIDSGHLPLDGWFPWLGFGSAHFHHYQTLAHVMGAVVSRVFGVETTYNWSLYLLLAFWPVSVYAGVRLMGWNQWTAAAAALLSPLLVSASGYGLEHLSYTWRGYGLWPQLWGMWLVPLAWGLSWRAIQGLGGYAIAALVIALATALHFLAGSLAFLGLAVFAVVAVSRLPWSLIRAGLIAIGAVIADLWVIVPLLSDARWIPTSEFVRGTIFADSFGAKQVLSWLITGRLYDDGRFPVVSILVGIGLVVCIARFRRDERVRGALFIWLISLILFMGPKTLSPLTSHLPMADLLPFHRFITGVHLAGLVIGGIGAAWLVSWLVAAGSRLIPEVKPRIQAGVLIAAGLLALAPAWNQVVSFDVADIHLKQVQTSAEASDGADLSVLIDRMRSLGPGRVYAGSRATWGNQYRIGYVPVYSVLSSAKLDVVGYTLRVTSLMTDPEALFDERNPAQYQLYNIRYLVLPADRSPMIDATLLARQGRHTLWQVDTTGYLQVVDAVGPPIEAGRGSLASQTAGFMESAGLSTAELPWIAYEGVPAPDPTFYGSASTSAGSVRLEQVALEDGVFKGEIVANRTAVVLLKSSYDPRWTATVDGVKVTPHMIAPAMVGVTVPLGTHEVVFRYAPFPSYPLLIGLGVLALVALAVVRRVVLL